MHFLDNRIKSLKISGAHLAVELLDGRAIRLRLSFFPTLAEASADQRSNWELCGAGTGIRWPMLDYDLSVAGLLRGEPEAPGIRRAKKAIKAVKYPVHQSGKAHTLAENADSPATPRASASPPLKSSSLVDTRVIYCGDCLEQRRR